MGFERNDVVFKNRLAEALEENTMGFEHNDIVTVDRMNAAIAGGGGGEIATPNVTATWKLDGVLPSGVKDIIFYGMVVKSNGEYVGAEVMNPDASEGVISGLCYPSVGGDENKLMWTVSFMAHDTSVPEEELAIAISDLVNCEDDGLDEVVITDPTKPASLTATISSGE